MPVIVSLVLIINLDRQSFVGRLLSIIMSQDPEDIKLKQWQLQAPSRNRAAWR